VLPYWPERPPVSERRSMLSQAALALCCRSRPTRRIG
jgi:hypothetical protein